MLRGLSGWPFVGAWPGQQGRGVEVSVHLAVWGAWTGQRGQGVDGVSIWPFVGPGQDSGARVLRGCPSGRVGGLDIGSRIWAALVPQVDPILPGEEDCCHQFILGETCPFQKGHIGPVMPPAYLSFGRNICNFCFP